MNIQFMTKEKNGRQTGETDWRGMPEYKYVPDFDALLENATCDEEREAILEAKDLLEDGLLGGGFNFEIVFTDKINSYNNTTGKLEKKWTVLQHPWYEDGHGIKVSKQTMEREIEETHGAGKQHY